MKFTNFSEYKNYLYQLLEDNELSLSISEMLSSVVGVRDLTNKKEMSSLLKTSNYQEKDILMSKVADYLDFDLSYEDNEDIFVNYISNVIYPLDIKEYVSNPFYQLFKNLTIKENEYELVTDNYAPYELFAYRDMSRFPDSYIEKNSIGYFSEEYPFLALNKKGVTWMSVTPNEIETMKCALEEIKGDVTIFGLGLGYFAYMASIKEHVKSVTIIENDQNVIALFNKYIYPKFEYKEKVKVIFADALEYINKPLKSDYAFVDLWHNPFDGLELFLKFKSVENKSPNCKFRYWLESSFYLLLRRCIFSLLAEQIEGLDESHYQKYENVGDKIINQYYKVTKNLTITSKVQLDNLLSDQSLLDLLINN